MNIPLFDLTRQYQNLRDEMINAFEVVISNGRVILGENVKKLEEEISDYIGVKHGIGVANGSDALFIALRALGIKEDDFVITTPYSFFATASCITRNGAYPIFVDIDHETYNINLDQVEEVLEKHPKKEKIKGLIPVHIFGQTVDLERLENIKENYGIKILEDCAQSIGSTWTYQDGTVKKGGSVGDAAIFSFFPTKNLGAYGDSGMIVIDDDEIADFCRSFRVHGSKKKYIHDFVGINSRLDELQAAFLRVKFKHLEEFEEKRKKIAVIYAKLFEEAGLGSRVWGLDKELDSTRPKNLNPKPGFVFYPNVPSDNSHVFHQYVVRFSGFTREKRDDLRRFLKENGIGTSIYYPMGLHQQKCFEEYVPDDLVLPETEKACKETLALPIFPEMTHEEVEYVVNIISKYMEGCVK